MHIISATDFPLFCLNYARKCLILPAECSPQKSLIMLEILPAEFIQALKGHKAHGFDSYIIASTLFLGSILLPSLGTRLTATSSLRGWRKREVRRGLILLNRLNHSKSIFRLHELVSNDEGTIS